MLFNSLEFLLFLPIVFILYWLVFKRSLRWQNILVLVASYFFYGWWSWKFMLLLAFNTFLDYIYGFYVASPNKKKAKLFLWLGIINNLAILGVFKYYNFFIVQFQQGFELLGLHTNPVLLNIALPVGISFYTFHGMSYVFDIYSGKQKAVTNYVEYAVFVTFFPLLVAGPIERASHLSPQIQVKREFKYTQAVEGCRLILWGMFKKVVIADGLSVVVNNIFNDYETYNAFSLLCGVIGFSFQIYSDFSGYSDLAIGTAKIFGFELLSNFKFPYFSRNISEFWRRWHISLSSWFRDYLYIKIGGSKAGKMKLIRNTFIVFLISGFWHGASWNYLIWGGIHACAMLPLIMLNKTRQYVHDVVAHNKIYPNLKELGQMFRTFTYVSFAWIFFRIQDLNIAINFCKKIITNSFSYPAQYLHKPQGNSIIFYIIPLVLVDWKMRENDKKIQLPKNKFLRYILYILSSILILSGLNLFSNHDKIDFIYFKF